ncbi:helix-turn-helix domain-containing protein [Arenicellales bacterium IMCC57338]
MKTLKTTDLINAVLDYQHKDLTPTRKMILAAIAGTYNPRTGQCNPGWRVIAKRLGVDRTSIHRAIHTANDLDMLSWVKLSYLGEGSQNSYCWQGLCPDAKPAWLGNPEEYEVRGWSKDRPDIAMLEMNGNSVN